MVIHVNKSKAAHFAALGRYATRVKRLAQKAAKEEQRATLKLERSTLAAIERQESGVQIARNRIRAIGHNPSVRGAKMIAKILADPSMPADVKTEASQLMLSWEQGDNVYALKQKRRRIEERTIERLRLERQHPDK